MLNKSIKDKLIVHSAVKEQSDLVDSSNPKNFDGVELPTKPPSFIALIKLLIEVCFLKY